MEQDTDKYFMPPDEQEDGNDIETISSTSTADYDQEEVRDESCNCSRSFPHNW